MSYVTASGRRLYVTQGVSTIALARAAGPNFGTPPTGPGGGSASIALKEFPRDRFAFDSGAWRGENNANVPVIVTATAGEIVQARMVPTDGGTSTAWVDMGTATGGTDQLIGYYSQRKHSSRLLLQVRIKSQPAVTATAINSIEVGHIVSIWGQSEPAQWQDTVAGGETPETLEIKHAVMALKNSWATGRRSTAPLKVPGVDALPAGVSRSGTDINITGTLAELTDWDFTGYKVWGRAGGSCAWFHDNILGERTGIVGIDTYLFVEVGSSIHAEYCDVTGWDGLADPLGSNPLGAPKACRAEVLGSGAGITVGDLHIRRFRFTNLPSDAVKITGCEGKPQVFEWNYIAPPVAYGNDRAVYDPGRTYVYGECCDNGPETYLCKVASSLGVTPPTGVASNTNWSWSDPHSDALQFPSAKNGAYIRFNYIEQLETPRNRGLNASIYITRDANNNDRRFDKVYVEWNYLPFTIGANGSSIIVGAGSVANPMVLPTIRNNWIGRRASGFNAYLKDGSLDACEMGGNIKLDTGAPLPASDFTNAIDVPALPEFADGRITHLWQDRSLGFGAAGIRTRVSTNATPYTPALAAISNAVLSVVGDDLVTFVHHTVSGTDWQDVLNDVTANRGWPNDEALHLHATGNGLTHVGAAYTSWYAAPSGFKDDYGKVLAVAFLGRHLDGSPVVTPVTVTYGAGGASQVTYQRTLALLYDWTYTKLILPDAHQFTITSAASPMTWSESGTSNHKDKRRSTISARLMQALPALSGYFTPRPFAPRPFAPNGYQSGYPQTAGNFDPAGTSFGDTAHPNKYQDQGQNTYARMTAYAILQAANLLPIPVPEFDEVMLMTDASVLRVGSSAGPIITSRSKNAETSISDTSATDHWTDVMGFEYSGAPVYQALLKPDGKVYVYPRSGTLPTSGPAIPNGIFTPGSTGMTFGMGGATGGLTHATDNLANVERNWPLVDFGLLGIDGVPVRQIPTALQGTHPTGTFVVP